MNNDKTLRIFMMPQEFPCGEQSSCCGPIGQSEEEIGSLKNNIEKELGYEVEILDVTNHDAIANYSQVSQLLSSFGPRALPILALGDEIVSMGNPAPEEAVAAIRGKTSEV